MTVHESESLLGDDNFYCNVYDDIKIHNKTEQSYLSIYRKLNYMVTNNIQNI